MRLTTVAGAILTLAWPALGSGLGVVTSAPGRAGGPPGTLGLGGVVYSNFATPIAGYTTTSTGFPYTNEVGDDLFMTSGGVLDSVKYTVWNADANWPDRVLTAADLQLKFYNGVSDPNGHMQYSYVGGFDIRSQPLGLTPGYYTSVTVTGLAGLNINLNASIVASLKITNLTGGSTQAGQVIFAPPTIGSSDSWFWKNGQFWWFDPPELSNFGWEIGVVPEPVGLFLFGLGVVLVRRR